MTTPKITNKKIEMIQRRMGIARKTIINCEAAIMVLTRGNTRAADTHRIACLRSAAQDIDAARCLLDSVDAALSSVHRGEAQ